MTQASAKIRLFVPQAFSPDGLLVLPAPQSHYLAHVMRAKPGQLIAVFNGQDGQWLAEIIVVEKKTVSLRLLRQTAPQQPAPDLWLAFAPIKHHMERMVEKAVELGASTLLPVITRHSVVRAIHEEKLMAHAIEAAEQCERHDVPAIIPCKDISELLAKWPAGRTLLHADETGTGKPLPALLAVTKGPFGVLVGPEGGFAADERAMLAASPAVLAFGMGSRILRADTAAIAALSCVQALTGGWEAAPRFTAGA